VGTAFNDAQVVRVLRLKYGRWVGREHRVEFLPHGIVFRDGPEIFDRGLKLRVERARLNDRNLDPEARHFWQGSGFVEALRPAMLEESPHQAPLDAVHHCLLKLISRYETKESIIVDRLLRSTESLRVRKQAVYVNMEQALLGAMCELWPEPKRRASLRIVAMVSIGAMRLAMEIWRQENGKRSLAKYLRESFATLKAEI
jgi:hypothetical protein